MANGNIVYDKLICTLDKAEACLRENISVLVDDLPVNCIAVSQKGISAIVFNSKGNRDIKTDFRRVEDWAGVLKAVIAIEQESGQSRQGGTQKCCFRK